MLPVCTLFNPYSTVVDCSTLNDPANGQVSITGTTFGETATYSCNTGYNLVGDNTRTCQATGVWSGNEPTCQCMFLFKLSILYVQEVNYMCMHIPFSTAVNCGNLTNPANGQVSTTGTTFGQTVTYSCNTGYNLMGDSTRTCQADGMWSGSAPTCQSMLYMKLFSS